jgi:probable rRNA maturation factor
MTAPAAAGSMRSEERRLGPRLEVSIEAPLWAAMPDAEAVVRDAIAAATAFVDSARQDAEVTVVLTDDATMRELNRIWRGIDKPTNVLAFPAAPLPAAPSSTVSQPRPGLYANGDFMPAPLGDIVIAFETTHREAEEEDKPFSVHLAHLTVHGFLHLLGYDHDSMEAAFEMERLEAVILARLGIPDPYRA